ncbi:MAG: HlyC/CorC family transporter [Clostridia bacterium]|nr:HlyC/CorC family transporter [Clostridia bacterium]
MDDGGPALQIIIPKLLLLLVLIVVNAFFAMSEIAIISLNDTKIKHLADEGDKKAKQIVKLTENSSRFLSTIQIGVTLAGFLTSASASASFAGIITKAVVGRWPGLSAGLISAVSVVVITIITSYFSLVLGELAPKKIAMQAPEKVSYKVVGILLFFSKLVKPFVKFLALSTNGVVRLFGFDPNADEENVTEEEIRLMVDAGEEKGVIENTQAEMIDNIFEFDDLDAGDIMTHRTDMVAIEATRALDEVADLCVENGYSRLPVYKDDQDNIIGVIYAKDLLKYVGRNIPSKLTIEKIMRKPLYVAETQACSDIFKAMNESRTQFAVVVDEYGGTAGIVTLEDVIESIVGNIRDEYDDDEEEEIVQINETTFTIDGTTNIDEVNSRAGVKLPEGDYDTLAGFIIDRLGYLPDENTELPLTIEYENIRFTVLSMDERRLEEIKVEILPPEDEDPEE